MYQILNGISHYSLLSSPTKLNKLIDRAIQISGEGCSLGLRDLNNLAGSVNFYKECKVKKVKPLLGCTFKIKHDDKIYDLPVIAKNLNGWKQLIKASSESNSEIRFDEQPLLDYEYFRKNCHNDWFVFVGNNDPIANSESGLDIGIIWDWFEQTFGLNNVILEIDAFSSQKDKLREFSRKKNIMCVPYGRPHCIDRAALEDLKLLVCIKLKTTFQELPKLLERPENLEYAKFFKDNNLYILENNEMMDLYSVEELRNTNLIAEMCESYDILSPPRLLSFSCPNGLSENDYLLWLLRQGWKRKIQGKVNKDKEQIYADRVKKETGVLKDFGLSSYFLILWDIIQFAKNNNILIGCGRGSSAGCLVSYLLDITQIDSIKYNLIFERFFNAGRAGSLPDIDIDIQSDKRSEIVQYIRNKYGKDRVCQLSTYQTIKARSAIKDVLRIHGGLSFDEINKISSVFPDEAKIADELQQMREDEEIEPSIIMWTLIHRRDELKEWCYLTDKNELDGPLAKRFEQAIRLESVKRDKGLHPSGYVIAPESLTDCCPMVLNEETKEMAPALEMGAMEAIGLVKLDILGLRLVNCIVGVKNLLLIGDVV